MLACVNVVPVTTDPPRSLSSPDRPALDRARLATGTAESRWTVEVLEEAGSTNAELTARFRSGRAGAVQEGTVLVAEHQTAGRGRLDRSWVTPARSALTLSILLAPDDVPVARWPWLPLLTGVAVAEAVRRACGVHAVLKWPNDVLAGGGGAKVAGILAERVQRGPSSGPGGRAAAVIGIGMNVSTTRAELPVDTATSLALEAAREVDRTDLLLHLLEALADGYDGWRDVRGDADAGVRAAYLSACDTVGRDVRIALPGGDHAEGRAVGVDDRGRLEVATATGPLVLGAGDVVHVRPARTS